MPTTTVIPATAPTSTAASSLQGLGEYVRSLKVESGLTWAQFAGLFGVTPRAVHFWVEGGRISSDHLTRLGRISQELATIDGTTPPKTREALFTIGQDGQTRYSRMIAEVNHGSLAIVADHRPLGSEEVPHGAAVPGTPAGSEDFPGLKLNRR